MENVSDIYKLSPIQSGMLFHVLKEPESGAYFAQYNCILEGDLDASIFQKSWQLVVERHAVLRTMFLWDNVKEPLQIVRKVVDIPWQHLDWKNLSAVEQQSALDSYLETDQQKGFDLSQAPLLRFTLIQMSPNNTQFVWSIHHLLIDGWSSSLLVSEVFSIYEQLLQKKAVQLDPAKPYSEYIAWLQQQNLDEAEGYWRNKLAGFTAPSSLPVGHLSENDLSLRSGYSDQHLSLDKETTKKLQNLARSSRLTMNTLIQGTWSILLSRYTHQQDVVFGVTMAGRPTDLAGSDKRVGLFLNTLPARVKLSPDQPLLDLFKDIQEQQLELGKYESTPLVKVQNWSDIPKGQPLFESIVVFENYPAVSNSSRNLSIKNPSYIEHSNYPLSLLIIPDQHNLRFIIVYDRSVYADTVVERLLGHLHTLLDNIAAGLNQSIDQLDILTQQEQQQLVEWNNTQTDYPKERCIHHLIEAHNESQTVAVVTTNNQSLSYRELHNQANQLAHHLHSLGVKPNTLIGLCVERSIEMIVGILGILKAGGAYVPLDPDYPNQRLASMLLDFADAETVLVTTTGLISNLPEHPARVVCIDDLRELPTTTPKNHILAKGLTEGSADDLAYMIYTSGSTGEPKGVLVSHRNLVHSTLARVQYYPEALNAFLLLSSFAFDSSVAGIFWCLSQGKTLVLPEPDQEKDIEALSNLIEKFQVSHTLCVPSLYRMILDYADPIKLGSLANVIVAGEACTTDLVAQHFQVLPETVLYNEYGPTEATVWSSVSRLQPTQAITIGRPIANTRVYILDEQQKALPVGVPGELYIAGEGVTQGYYNQLELTEAFFVPDPFCSEYFSSEPCAKCYRSGDLARYKADGSIEFLGRVDQQIKIHGYRIELGEIETVLKQIPGVLGAVAIARDDQLLAYVKSFSVSISDCEALLALELPEYMQPNHVVILDEFPLLPNGKTDLQALPEPEQQEPMEGFVAPRSDVEQTLVDIWADVLNLDRVSIEDHFLQIGGDSILSIQIIAKARQKNLFFTPKDLFERPQISRLSELVETRSNSSHPQTQVKGEVPLTPIQHWFFETIKPVLQHWNQAVQLSISKALTPAMVHEVMVYLCQHHDALRMKFVDSTKGWQQFNQGKEFQLPWKVMNLSDLSLLEQEEQIVQTADQLQQEINFSTSLVQAAFFQMGKQIESRLLIIVHHLVIDHVSWTILLEDLERLFQQKISQKTIQLSAKTTSYKDWATQLVDSANNNESSQQLTQWLNFLPETAADVPTDHPDKRSEHIEKNHTIHTVSLDHIQTQELLHKVPKAYQTHINDILLTALLQTLFQWTGDKSWLIDMELHGREQDNIDLSHSVGWFTSYFPVSLYKDEQESGALLKSVKEQLRKIPQKGLSYGGLRYLSAETELSKLPQADILFNYLGQTKHPKASVCKVINGAKNGLFRNPDNQRSHLLEINSVISEGILEIHWSYSHALYQQATIESLAQSFLISLQGFIKHCQSPDIGGFTPSDFADSGLNQNQLDQFIDNITKND